MVLESATAAVNANNALSGTTLPLMQAQYGASLGGPIVRNRTFYFTNFEQRILNQDGVGSWPPDKPLIAFRLIFEYGAHRVFAHRPGIRIREGLRSPIEGPIKTARGAVRAFADLLWHIGGLVALCAIARLSPMGTSVIAQITFGGARGPRGVH